MAIRPAPPRQATAPPAQLLPGSPAGQRAIAVILLPPCPALPFHRGLRSGLELPALPVWPLEFVTKTSTRPRLGFES